ncbi:hypothetical protein Tco_0603081 [Tanacetum coccineum]
MIRTLLVSTKPPPTTGLESVRYGVSNILDTRIDHVSFVVFGGSSEGAGLEPDVPDEQKGKSTDTSEGTGLILGVLDVSKADSSESETSDDEEETQEDEFVYTPENYLKDIETADKGKYDEEMTDAEKVDAKNENINQEVVGDQVNGDAQAIVTAAFATQKTKVPLKSSSISSDYATKFLNFDNIPSADTNYLNDGHLKAAISTTYAPDSSTLTAIHQRLFDLENEVKSLRNVDHGLAIHAEIKSKVPTIVKEYLGTSLDDTLHKVIQRHTAELIKEHSVPADVVEVPPTTT